MKRRHFVDTFKRKFFLRAHMSMLMLCVYLFGVFVDWALYKAKLLHMPARYGVAMLAAYAASFVLVGMWLELVKRDPGNAGSRFDAEDAADALELGVDVAVDTSSASASSVDFDIGDGEGAVIVIALIIIFILVLLLGGYLIWEAPNILAEAAFQAAVAGAVARPSKRLENRVAHGQTSWAGAFFRGTVIPFAVALALVVGGAALATSHCEGADKASDIRVCLAA